jgi:hypothetical protein
VQETTVEPLVALAVNKPLLAVPETTIVKNKPPLSDSISVAVATATPCIFVNLQEVMEVLFDGTVCDLAFLLRLLDSLLGSGAQSNT